MTDQENHLDSGVFARDLRATSGEFDSYFVDRMGGFENIGIYLIPEAIEQDAHSAYQVVQFLNQITSGRIYYYDLDRYEEVDPDTSLLSLSILSQALQPSILDQSPRIANFCISGILKGFIENDHEKVRNKAQNILKEMLVPKES
jgi:hypothetical protein